LVVEITHALLVEDPGEPSDARITRHQLWLGLLLKAKDPVPFVPAITGCRVLESVDGKGLLREIVVRGRDVFRERIEYEPERRVVFHQLDDPDLETIVNEIGRNEAGDLVLTLRVTLSRSGAEKADRHPMFRRGLDQHFADTLQAMVPALRRASRELADPAVGLGRPDGRQDPGVSAHPHPPGAPPAGLANRR
jgi:hypothetical protein